MISDRLRARADRLAGCALHNKPFTPQECAALAQELLCWADIAESMETTRFAPEALSELADYLDTTPGSSARGHKRDAA